MRHTVSSGGWRVMICTGVAIALAAFSLGGEEKPPAVEWSARDVRGAEVRIPDGKRPTVVVFVLGDQPQSQQALEQVKSTVGAPGDVQVVVVVSGKEAEGPAKKLAEDAKLGWPVIADMDYTGSGKLGVHVWPTTVVIRSDGQEVGHLAGAATGFAKDLEGYLAFAAGKIDAAALQRRLESHDTVIDSPGQMAERHLVVARRLFEKDLAEQARLELERGLKLQPENGELQLAMAEVLLSLGEASGAMEMLEQVDEKGGPGWRMKVLRGQALVALGKWEDAEGVLEQAVRLNPDPSGAYYELGRVYEHGQKWQQAADAYRRAFETTGVGRKLAAGRRGVGASTRPATRP